MAISRDFSLSSLIAAPENETALGAVDCAAAAPASDLSASATRSRSAMSMAFLIVLFSLEQPRSIALR